MHKESFKLTNIIIVLLLIFGAILFLFPLYLVYVNSFKSLGKILSETLNIPEKISIANFIYVFKKMKYIRAFLNTTIVTSVSIVLSVIVSSMCAYKFSRSNDKKSKIIMLGLFSSMIIPFQTIMIPLVKVAKAFNMVDSIPGLIIVTVALFSPFAVFLYFSFLKTIPMALDEAARIDGCSEFQAFFLIVFPLLGPVTASVVVIDALWIWNDFALPLVMLQSAENKTVTLVIYSFFGANSMRWDYALAGLTLSSLPILIFYVFMQKYIISGVVSGSVKG